MVGIHSKGSLWVLGGSCRLPRGRGIWGGGILTLIRIAIENPDLAYIIHDAQLYTKRTQPAITYTEEKPNQHGIWVVRKAPYAFKRTSCWYEIKGKTK